MKSKKLAVIIGVIAGFVALTAIGGGLALLSGAEETRFPLAWLEGTPFQDYTFPGILLTFAVGGSSLTACISLFKKYKWSSLISFIAGCLLCGFITIELLILKQNPPGPTPIEILYLTLGLTMIVLSASFGLRKFNKVKDIN